VTCGSAVAISEADIGAALLLALHYKGMNISYTVIYWFFGF
jgi:hypothetical protein